MTKSGKHLKKWWNGRIVIGHDFTNNLSNHVKYSKCGLGTLSHPSPRLPWFLWFLWFPCYFHGISLEFYGIQVHPGIHGIQNIAIVAMVYMLFPWHFSGIIWHLGRMLWNTMEFHGIQNIAIVLMVSMLFPWHFSGILWHPGGMPWKSMGYRR